MSVCLVKQDVRNKCAASCGLCPTPPPPLPPTPPPPPYPPISTCLNKEGIPFNWAWTKCPAYCELCKTADGETFVNDDGTTQAELPACLSTEDLKSEDWCEEQTKKYGIFDPHTGQKSCVNEVGHFTSQDFGTYSPKYRWAVYFCPQYCGLCKVVPSPPPAPPPVCACEGTSLNFTTLEVFPNNLGGFGPDFGEEQTMRYLQVDEDGLYDLEVTNTSFYDVNRASIDGDGVWLGAQRNGVNGNFGQVNLQQGVSTDIEMCFYYQGTETPATIEKFYFSFMDFDSAVQSGQTQPSNEVLTMQDYTNFYVVVTEVFAQIAGSVGTLCEIKATNQLGNAFVEDGDENDGAEELFGTDVDWIGDSVKEAVCTEEDGGAAGGGEATSFYDNYPCTELRLSFPSGSSLSAASTTRGFGCDNPVDPKTMSEVQLARTITFEFVDVTCMEMNYESGGDPIVDSGRNFLFAGASFECNCDPPSPYPPSPPPPPPPSPPPPVPSAPCECEGTNLDFTTTTTAPNNLGGYGPDFGEERTMRFIHVDTNSLYDLEVSNTSYYDVNRGFDGVTDETADNGEMIFKGVVNNGVYGAFGNVNLQQGMSTNFELCFYFTGTEDLAVQDMFFFSFFDLDQGTSAGMTQVYREQLTMTDPESFYVNIDGVNLKDFPGDVGTKCMVATQNGFGDDLFAVGTEIDGADDFYDGYDWVATPLKQAVCEALGGGAEDSFFSNYPCTDVTVTQNGDSVTATSSTKGYGCDNPTDPSTQTAVQTARSIMFQFVDTTCMEVEYHSVGDVATSSGRNFLFAGAAFECECAGN